MCGAGSLETQGAPLPGSELGRPGGPSWGFCTWYLQAGHTQLSPKGLTAELWGGRMTKINEHVITESRVFNSSFITEENGRDSASSRQWASAEANSGRADGWLALVFHVTLLCQRLSSHASNEPHNSEGLR